MKIEKIIQTTFLYPQQKALVNLRFTSNYLSGIQNGFMADYGITMPQFNILRILRGAKDAINVNSMKERMVEKSPNTTRLLDKLEAKKLIERTHCMEDRRVVFVQIKEDGLALLEIIDKKIKEKNLFATNLTDEEAEQLSDLLDKLREGISTK